MGNWGWSANGNSALAAFQICFVIDAKTIQADVPTENANGEWESIKINYTHSFSCLFTDCENSLKANIATTWI